MRTLSDFTCYMNIFSVFEQYLSADGQSQTRSLHFVGETAVYAIKLLKDLLKVLFIDPDSVVIDGNPDLFRIFNLSYRQYNVSFLFFFITVFDGIGDEIDKYLMDPLLIAFHKHLIIVCINLYLCV